MLRRTAPRLRGTRAGLPQPRDATPRQPSTNLLIRFKALRVVAMPIPEVDHLVALRNRALVRYEERLVVAVVLARTLLAGSECCRCRRCSHPEASAEWRGARVGSSATRSREP